MAQDITEQATQEDLANSLVAEIEEPQEQETEQPDTETAELQEGETQEGEQTEEDGDDWLPGDQEKVFPDEVLLKYAQRFQKDDKWLAEPTNRQLLIDKINSDIYIRTLQEQQQQRQQEAMRPAERQPEVKQEPTPQPQISREEYFRNIEHAVAQRTDPQIAQQFYGEFMKAFGVPDADIAALAPQQAMQFTQTLSKYALNLFNTFADDMLTSRLSSHLEQNYPQFGEMYQLSAAALSWDAVRSESSPDLPAYGTPQYSQAARAIGAEIAGTAERFENMVFTDDKGQPLNARDNLAEKQRMIAERMMRGQEPQVPPALVAQAVQTGQKMATRAQAQRKAGQLGAGKSNAKVSGGDDFWDEGLALYQNQHGRL